MSSNLTLTDRAKQIRVVGLLLACAIACWIAFYPGFMSYDSLVQYGMSKSLQFTDWHPPLMSLVWSVLGFFFPDPSGMLALHVGLAWLSVYIWWRNYQDRPLSWLLFTIPFLPWVLNFIGVLWKDVGLAFSLLALAGLALSRPSFGKILLALTLAFYAINLRHNAIFAVFPILLFLSKNWLNKTSLLRAGALSGATILFCVLFGSILNYNILHSEKTKPSNYMMVDDLVYLSIKHDESFLAGFSIDELRDCAAFEIGGSQLVGKVFCLSKYPSYTQAAPLASDLRNVWISKIREFPIDYLQFRMAAFSYLLRTPADPPYYIWHAGVDANDFGFKNSPNGLTLISERFVKGMAAFAPFFFKPYWWLFVSLIFLASSFILNDTKTVSAARILLISSVLYVIGYIPATPMADFRYVYWSVVSTSVAVLILVVDWPGVRSKSTKHRIALLSTLILVTGALLFGHGKITALNIDEVLSGSLAGERTVLDGRPVVNDLSMKDGGYLVAGNDPYLVFYLTDFRLQTRDLSWLKLDFHCVGLSSSPVLQFFWWGDQQVGPTEPQSITRRAAEGINLIPVKDKLGSSSLNQLRGIRLDLSNADACKSIEVKNIEFIKNPN